MFDIIDTIGKSTVHHGKNSNRVYVMSLHLDDLPEITIKLDELAGKNGYSKIIAKIPLDFKEVFKLNGYDSEAVIPNFFNGEKDVSFMCKYLDLNRKNDPFMDKCKEILDIALQKASNTNNTNLSEDFTLREVTEKDINDMTKLYKLVFKSYPFPIHDGKYILKTMQENLKYFGIWHKKNLVALSSIELARKYSNAEMTDFAVHPEFRGYGFALYLLKTMEKKLFDMGIKTAYTIARSISAGMNITFAKNGYNYGGTLINNTDISGQIESMNVWYKPIFKKSYENIF